MLTKELTYKKAFEIKENGKLRLYINTKDNSKHKIFTLFIKCLGDKFCLILYCGYFRAPYHFV